MVDYAHKWTDQKLAEMETHLRSIYKDAADEASVICSDYMQNFSDRYVEQYTAYMNGAYTKQQFEEWYAAQIGRGERWEAVRQNMAEAMTHSNEIAADYMNSQMPAVFAHNYNWSSYTIEIGTTRANLDGADMAISFTLVDENTVKRLATTTPDLLPKARVDVPKDIAWNQRKMQNALLQGILLGDSVDKIAARIALAAGHMNEVSAMRNARTMVTEAENRGRLENYREAEKMGLNIQKEWIATNDDRTRESHAELSGVRVAVKDLFPNGCICPGDHRGDPAEVYNCRCTMRSVFPGSASEKAHVTGKTVETYNDWLKRKLEEKVIASVTKHVTENSATDSVQKVHGLTDEEMNSVNTYISSGAYLINDELRRGVVSTETEKIIDSLDAALEKMPKYEGVVYRSIDGTFIDEEAFMKIHSEGGIVSYDPYTSTSKEVYDETMTYQFVINSKSGRDLSDINVAEKEVLFERGSSFIITKVDGKTFYMEEIV